MSAIAGRVLLIPKGAYDANVTYHMLDVVSYGGNSYVAKQTTAGNTPSADNAYWMLLSAGSAVASINDIGDVLITSPTNGQVLKYNTTSQKWENGQDTGGLLPHLIIISETGEDVVKAVKGSTEIIATETSTGHYECDVPEFGTWTIHAVLNGDDAQVNLVVDTVKVYTVDDSHFHADITVTYPSGGTCSCSKSGETTLYATGSPYTFTVHSAGAWTITTTAYEKTFIKIVNVSSTGQAVYISVPDGATVTPTDDVQTLLACAGIGDSQITTLAELLADTTTLSAVINSNNAVDYMVRSTTWATQITVPTMTSNTTPEGIAFGSGKYSGDFYNAFDNNDSSSWQGSAGSSAGGNGEYVGYTFPNAVVIDSFDLYGYGYSAPSDIYYFKIQGSNDGVTWIDLTNNVRGVNNTHISGNVEKNKGAYTSYRAIMVDSTSSTAFGVYKFQLYSASITADATAMTYIGLNNYATNTLLADATWCEAICNSEYFESVLNVKVPTMTGYTTPEGEVIYTSTSGSDYPWRAFNESITSGEYVNSRSDGYIGYIFPSAQKIYMADLHIHADYYHTSMCLDCSEDGVTWNNLTDFVSTPAGSNTKIITNNPSAMRYWRVYGQGAVSNYVYMYQMNFYGREDV